MIIAITGCAAAAQGKKLVLFAVKYIRNTKPNCKALCHLVQRGNGAKNVSTNIKTGIYSNI